MMYIIEGIVAAIVCFFAFRFGYKEGEKIAIKEWNDLYNDGFNDGVTYNRIFSKYEKDNNSITDNDNGQVRNGKRDGKTDSRPF